MEKIQSICLMCDVMRALAQMERQLMRQCGLTLNEAMVMCCIAGDTVSASDVCAHTGLMSSHASKVIRSVEEKGYITRGFGRADKRQMLFSLTAKGRKLIQEMKENALDVPEVLKGVLSEA